MVDAQSDSGVLDGPVDAGPLGAFGTATPLFSQAGLDDDDPSLTADMLEIYFNRAGAIYVATRTTVTSAWSAPSVVTQLQTGSGGNDTTPEISADGLTIYFASNRAPTTGGFDIWMATRVDRIAPWSSPVAIGELSSMTDDFAGCMTADGLHIAMSRGMTATADLAEASRDVNTAPWNAPALLAGINSAVTDFSPCLTNDGRAVYFDSTRTSSTGDLYVARRFDATKPFLTANPITELNTTMFAEVDPWISPDERHVYFVSTRFGDGKQHLYEASR